MATFEKMRISLSLSDKTPMFGDQEGPSRTRAEYFTDAFAERRDFLPSRGRSKLTFLPIPAPTGFIAGFFGKESVQKGRLGPDTAFSETMIATWDIALFVMNIAPDSQVCWMQTKSEVGSPKSVLEAFLKSISKNSSFGEWNFYVKYMDSEGAYWESVNKYKRQITKLEFTFIPPNALNARDTVGNFTRRVSEELRAQTQTHTYKAPPGQMEPTSELATASAEIATEGGGEARAFVGKKIVYDSNDHRTRKDIADDELPTPAHPTFLRRVIDRLWPHP